MNAPDRSIASLLSSLAQIVGSGHCLTPEAAMAPYLAEPRGLYPGRAGVVVRPATTDETSRVVAACAAACAPVVVQGGNTGMCGGAAARRADAVIVSTERLDRVRDIDPLDFTMVVEAGCILADVQRVARDAGCFFPLSLGAEGSCRIGGNLGTNAGGVNVLRYGNARELVLGLEVVLPDGRVWNGLRALRKDNTGYALKHLFVGAEGTLGIITAASLRLFPLPVAWHTAFVAVDRVGDALALLAELRRQTGDAVTACEVLPRIALDFGFAHMPGGRDPLTGTHPWYVLLELSAFSEDTGLRAALERVVGAALESGRARDAVLAESMAQRDALWKLREIGAGGHQFQEGAIIKHDVAVPVRQVEAFIAEATAAVEAACPGVRVVAFGHLGDGNVHFNLVQPKGAPPRPFLDAQAHLNRIVHDMVDRKGGSISAEHGIGLLKIDEMARYKSPVELDLMRAIKRSIDPGGLMNPGKILPPDPSRP